MGALQLLSRKKGPVAYESIDDPDNTIFAVDIRKLGWDEKPLSHPTGKKNADGKDVMEPADLNYFDLLLLEYPYGVYRKKSASFDELVDKFLYPYTQVSPIAYIRGDWLASAVPALRKEMLGKEMPVDFVSDPLSKAKLDFQSPLTVRMIAAELNVPETDAQRTASELELLTPGGTVPRDEFEASFDLLITKLGLGIPLVPLDGLNGRDHLRSKEVRVTLGSNKPGNEFRPGDMATITLANNSKTDIFIEAFATNGTSDIGKKYPLKRQWLKKGKTLTLFENKIGKQKGTDFITVYASSSEFPSADLVRGNKVVTDRVIHSFNNWTLNEDSVSTIDFDPTSIVKETIGIVTK